ncbi:hypothetical protein HHI36_013978 [Cryptolaemus montrouzieri]
MTKKYSFPYEMRDLTDEEKDILSYWPEEIFKLIGTRTCCPIGFKGIAEDILNFKPRPDDIWLIGYPRAGTSLTQEILYLLGTDLNYEKAASTIMDIRFPVLHCGQRPNSEFEKILGAPPHLYLENTREKRFIKSHYGFNLLHPEILDIGCKVIFIARNPKDNICSVARFPFFANVPGFNFKKLWNTIEHDLLPFGNYFEMLQEAWERRNNKNLLILYYEEINKDKKAAVLKIADFLGKKLTDDQLQTLLKHIDIDNFKKNKSLNNDHLVESGFFGKDDKSSFIRQGKDGGWRNDIPEELVAEIDHWIKNNFQSIPDVDIIEQWKLAMDLK